MFIFKCISTGGLKRAELLDKHLVSVFVPFLPLERAHVRLCVYDDLRNKGYPIKEKFVDDVLEEMSFFPPKVFGDDDVQFSETGCKRVMDKVDLLAYEQKLRRKAKGELWRWTFLDLLYMYICIYREGERENIKRYVIIVTSYAYIVWVFNIIMYFGWNDWLSSFAWAISKRRLYFIRPWWFLMIE